MRIQYSFLLLLIGVTLNGNSSSDELFSFEELSINSYSVKVNFPENSRSFYGWSSEDDGIFWYELDKKSLVRQGVPCKKTGASNALWSSDMKTLVMSSYEKLFVCFSDKSELLELASSGRGYSYVWKNPDEFFFAGEIGKDYRSGIYLFNVKTRKLSQLLDGKYCRFCKLSGYSSKESRIFYSNILRGDGIEFLSAEIKNDQLKNIETIIYNQNIWSEGFFSLTKDGKYGVFTGHERSKSLENSERIDLFFIDVERKLYKKILVNKNQSVPFAFISPDGNFIVIMSSGIRYSAIDLAEIFKS